MYYNKIKIILASAVVLLLALTGCRYENTSDYHTHNIDEWEVYTFFDTFPDEIIFATEYETYSQNTALIISMLATTLDNWTYEVRQQPGFFVVKQIGEEWRIAQPTGIVIKAESWGVPMVQSEFGYLQFELVNDMYHDGSHVPSINLLHIDELTPGVYRKVAYVWIEHDLFQADTTLNRPRKWSGPIWAEFVVTQ